MADPTFAPALLDLTKQQTISVASTISGVVSITRGTNFPASPADGDIFVYTADATNGVKWAFQFDSSQATYKWVFIGGAPLWSEVTTSETTSSTSYAALATAGPAIVIPRAGDYLVTIQANMNDSSVSVAMSYDIGGVAAVDADAARSSSSASSGTAHITAFRLKTGLSASVSLTAKYKTSAGTVPFADRRMMVLPVRVS